MNGQQVLRQIEELEKSNAMLDLFSISIPRLTDPEERRGDHLVEYYLSSAGLWEK